MAFCCSQRAAIFYPLYIGKESFFSKDCIRSLMMSRNCRLQSIFNWPLLAIVLTHLKLASIMDILNQVKKSVEVAEVLLLTVEVAVLEVVHI